MFKRNQLFVLVMLLMFAAVSTGCSSVDYVKNVDQSVKHLKALNDQLNVAKRNADSPAFAQLLDEMRQETERVNAMDGSWMTSKVEKEVRKKNAAITALLSQIEEEAGTGSADSEKLDSFMKQLSDGIQEAVE